MVPLRRPGDGIAHRHASAISADGSTIVGRGVVVADTHESLPMRWTAAQGMVTLGDMPGGSTTGSASAANGDGSVIVGISDTERGSEAFIYDDVDGMRNLRDVLSSVRLMSRVFELTSYC
jgi:probable HAF family extracellular repeat protein